MKAYTTKVGNHQNIFYFVMSFFLTSEKLRISSLVLAPWQRMHCSCSLKIKQLQQNFGINVVLLFIVFAANSRQKAHIEFCFHFDNFRLVKSDRAALLMNLCVALIISYVLFLVGIDRAESEVRFQSQMWNDIVLIILWLFSYLFQENVLWNAQ